MECSAMKDELGIGPASLGAIKKMVPALELQLQRGEDLLTDRPVDVALYQAWAHATEERLRGLCEHFSRSLSEFGQSPRSPITASRTMGGTTDQAYRWEATAKLENQLKVLQNCLRAAIGESEVVSVLLPNAGSAPESAPTPPGSGTATDGRVQLPPNGREFTRGTDTTSVEDILHRPTLRERVENNLALFVLGFLV